MVERELKRANLHHPSGELALFVTLSKPRSAGHDMPPDVEGRHLYRTSLQMYLQSAQRNLDVFALLGSLFREAYLVCALEIAVVLKDLLCELLEEFCNQEWLQKDGTGLQLLELAESRIFHWRMDDVTNDGEGYDDLPMSVVERPLLQRNDALKWLIKNESVRLKEYFDAIRSSL